MLPKKKKFKSSSKTHNKHLVAFISGYFSLHTHLFIFNETRMIMFYKILFSFVSSHVL
jgi:hypothetical protein